MFGLVDCNNFFVSCERAFNPSLEGKPVLVLSSNDGCVISRSNETKALGVKMGQPFYQVRDLVRKHNITVFSTNFVLYGDMSHRVMRLLKEMVPSIEIYSIDEAFLDLDGFDDTRLRELVRRIVRSVRKGVGIPVSLGIAPTKTLAKVAARFAKTHAGYKGVCLIDDEPKRVRALQLTAIGDVWGIGRRLTRKLEAVGIRTAYDFTQMSPEWVRATMSVVGLRIWKELHGEPCIGFEDTPANKQQICVCGQIHLFIVTNRHRPDLPQCYESKIVRLPIPTDSTLELTAETDCALRQIFVPGYGYKRAGVILSDILPREGLQQYMFDEIDRTKHSRLMKTLDELNGLYGRHSVVTAAQGFEPLTLHREHLSQRYTTEWDEILRVKAE